MKSIKTELQNIAKVLESERISYMVIGGMANLEWGEPRSTFDIDITVKIDESQVPLLLQTLSKDYVPLLQDPVSFALKNRALPIRSLESGIKVDLILSMMPYEEEAIRRAVGVDIDGVTVKYCTAEDLVLHKIISSRPKDQQDVASIIHRRRNLLDLAYLRPRVEELSTLLSMPEMMARFQALLARE